MELEGEVGATRHGGLGELGCPGAGEQPGDFVLVLVGRQLVEVPGDGLRQLGPVGHPTLGLPDRVDDRDVVLGAPQVGEPDELDGAQLGQATDLPAEGGPGQRPHHAGRVDVDDRCRRRGGGGDRRGEGRRVGDGEPAPRQGGLVRGDRDPVDVDGLLDGARRELEGAALDRGADEHEVGRGRRPQQRVGGGEHVELVDLARRRPQPVELLGDRGLGQRPVIDLRPGGGHRGRGHRERVRG